MIEDTSRMQNLEDRVSALEQDVDGERMVSRHILQETRANTDLLAAIKTRQDRMEDRLDGMERKVDGIDQGLKSLTRSLPRIVTDAIREVDRERRRRERPEGDGD
jgi:hypothetical protein